MMVSYQLDLWSDVSVREIKTHLFLLKELNLKIVYKVFDLSLKVNIVKCQAIRL